MKKILFLLSFLLPASLMAQTVPFSRVSGRASNDQLPVMATGTLKGNNTGSIGSPGDLTPPQVRALLSILDSTNYYPKPTITSLLAGKQGALGYTPLNPANNLSDLPSASTARTNLGLGNVDNTSDANKPVSTAQQTALNGKEPVITPGTTAQYLRGDKTFSNFGTSTRNSSVAQSLSLSNTAIVASDSVAVAFGKAQGQINANAAAIATNSTKVSNNAANSAKNQVGVYSVRDTITQSAHGFSAGQVVRKSGTWKLAQANNAANAEALGIIESATTNTFVVVTSGKITLSGLTADTTYFLSPTTPGLLTLTAPIVTGQISKPILRSYSTTVGQVMNMRGITIVPSSSQVNSFNSRTGVVMPQSGDYPASLIPLVVFSSGAGSVSNGDNVLQAIQKLDGNISANTSNITSLTPTNVLSSSGTLTLVPVANAVAWYTFSGTTTTWTLPALSGNTNATFGIKNRGSGNITLNSNAGGTDIYTSSAVNTYSITPGQAVFIHNDSGAWSVE